MVVAAVAATAAVALRWNYLGNLLHFQCEPGLGASVMYNLLYFPPYKLMLLAGCSTVCTTVAEAAKMWNLVVVSCLSMSFSPSPDLVYANLTFYRDCTFRGTIEIWEHLRYLSLALLWSIVAGAVWPKSIPDPLQDASFRHRAQSHENQIVGEVWLVSRSDTTASRGSVYIGKNVKNILYFACFSQSFIETEVFEVFL